MCAEDGVSPCNEGLEPAGGICTAPPPCGAAGEICCPPDDGCDSPSLACVSGTCTPCGALGEPVCTGVPPPPSSPHTAATRKYSHLVHCRSLGVQSLRLNSHACL